MADWTAPFRPIRMPTEEFLRMKRDYIAKYGYQITIPGFEDIIHLPIYEPLSLAEEKIWKAKDYELLSPARYEEIKYMKQRRKERFLAMLASPAPEIFNARAAIMTSLDDAEDAMSTIAAIGKISIPYLPRTIGKLLTGPLGWIMGTAELLNLAETLIAPEMVPLRRKRVTDSVTELNPFSKKARAKYAQKLRKGRLTAGDIIEGLQTTDNIFGVGLCLGPIMALPVDIIAGNVRMVTGEPVTVKYPWPDMGHWERVAKKALSGLANVLSFQTFLDATEKLSVLSSANIAAQIENTFSSVWNALDATEDIHLIEVKAPAPTNILTLEVIEELGDLPENGVRHPQTGEKWSTYNEIFDAGYEPATQNFQDFCYENKSNWHGFIEAANAVESSLHMIECFEGHGSVDIDYTAACKTMHALHYLNYEFPPDLQPDQRDELGAWLDEHERRGTCPTTPEVLSYAKTFLGFEFQQFSP